MLQNTLEDISYSYGGTLRRWEMVKAHTCNDPVGTILADSNLW